MDDYRVVLKQVRETPDLRKWMAEVPVEDLLDTLHQVSAYEIIEQARLGNKPSAVIVDGGRGDIRSAKRRVDALFGQVADIAPALHDAFSLLRQLTRVRTGRAQAAYALYINDKYAGDESAVERALRGFGAEDWALVLGPLVRYGRKLWWSGISGGGLKPLRVRKFKRKGYLVDATGQRYKLFSKRQESIGQYVQRTLRSRYPALTITEMWLPSVVFSGIPDRDNRAPGIMIRMKRGR